MSTFGYYCEAQTFAHRNSVSRLEFPLHDFLCFLLLTFVFLGDGEAGMARGCGMLLLDIRFGHAGD